MTMLCFLWFEIWWPFCALDRKGNLSWKGNLVVAGTVLKVDWEALEARICAASRTSGYSLGRTFQWPSPAGPRHRLSTEMCSGLSLLDPGKWF